MYRYVTETCRKDRCHNIAVAILRLHEEYPQTPGIRTDSLRQCIRQALCLPELDGEQRLGDLRAHGDALGGHGLKLKAIRHGSHRVVDFSATNLAVCTAYLNEEPERQAGYLATNAGQSTPETKMIATKERRDFCKMLISNTRPEYEYMLDEELVSTVKNRLNLDLNNLSVTEADTIVAKFMPSAKTLVAVKSFFGLVAKHLWNENGINVGGQYDRIRCYSNKQTKIIVRPDFESPETRQAQSGGLAVTLADIVDVNPRYQRIVLDQNKAIAYIDRSRNSSGNCPVRMISLHRLGDALHNKQCGFEPYWGIEPKEPAHMVPIGWWRNVGLIDLSGKNNHQLDAEFLSKPYV